MSDKVSVIVPVYNAERGIEACLNSLLAQSYANLEILIVNDGSVDESERIIRKFARQDPRIKLFCTENQGVSAARNIALENVTGEWIAFCDSDDIVPKNAYKRMLQAARRTNAEIVVGSLKVQKPRESFCFRYRKKQVYFSLFYNGPSLCNRLFKYSVFRGLRFNSITIGEDVVFLTKAFNMTNKIVPIGEVVYIYVHQEDSTQKSLTHSYSLDTFMGHLNAWSEVKNQWGPMAQARGESYLACITTPYLYQQMLLVPTIESKCAALSQFRAFLDTMPWDKYSDTFEAVFGVTYGEFQTKSDIEYFHAVLSLDCKERVSTQFQAGNIGFRYILKYLILWLKFKCHGR